jgi:hypothetical protein
MTEYEVADLAFSKTMELQGLGALFQAQLDSAGGIIQQFMTVLFGYLVAAHFIGADLSRRQAVIFSSLYAIWQIWAIVLHTVRGIGVRITLEEIRPLRDLPQMTEIMPQIVAVTQFSLLVAALAASLFFMWDVRRSKNK